MAKSVDHAGAERILQQALRHHRAHRLQEASALYRRVLTMRPGDAASLQNLALIAMERGRYPFAIELLSRAVSQQPDDAGAHYNLGLALHNLGRVAEAIASYDRALASRADFVEARYNRGNALRALKRYKEAEAAYRHALTLKPDFPGAWNNLGTTLRDLRRPAEAEQAYVKALASHPNDLSDDLPDDLGVFSDREFACELVQCPRLEPPAHNGGQLSLNFLFSPRHRRGLGRFGYWRKCAANRVQEVDSKYKSTSSLFQFACRSTPRVQTDSKHMRLDRGCANRSPQCSGYFCYAYFLTRQRFQLANIGRSPCTLGC